MAQYDITTQQMSGHGGLGDFSLLTVQNIGIADDVVYVFYSDLNDWVAAATPFKISYKYSTDAFVAQRHLTVNIGGTDEDICGAGIDICQGDNCIYLFGFAKHGGNSYNTYTLIDATGITSRAVEQSVDPLDGLIGPHVYELTPLEIFSNVSIIDWAGLAVTSTVTYPVAITPTLCIQDYFVNPMFDDQYIYFEFRGYSESASVTAKLNYYFLVFDKINERYAYLPFQLDFTPDVPVNNYERKRVMAMCPDWQGKMMICLNTYTYKGWVDLSAPDTFPWRSQWQYTEFAASYDWVVGYVDRSIFSRMQKCDAVDFANTYYGKVFAGALQSDVSIAFWITQLDRDSPFVPISDAEVVKTGLANYALNNTGLFGGTNNWYGNCQWLCTNRHYIDCNVFLSTSVFNGVQSPGGDDLPKYTLQVHSLNTGGVPPKPIYLTSKVFWDLYGFRLYAGYSGQFDTIEKEIKIYESGAPISTRTVTDANKYIDIIAGDSLAWDKEYDYGVRYKDDCLNWGAWSDWTKFWTREKVTVSALTIGVSQRPTVEFTITPYGSLIKNILLEVYDGATLITSLNIDDVYNYVISETSTTITLQVIIDPELLSETLKAQLYTFRATVTNDYDRVTVVNTNQTLVFAALANATNLVITKRTGYLELNWTGGNAAIYRNGTRIGEDTSFKDYECLLNIMNNYVICTRDSTRQGTGLLGSESIVEYGISLVSEDFQTNTFFPEQSHITENSNTKNERIGDDIFFDYYQESGSFQCYLSRDDNVRLRNNYFDKQFYLKYNKIVYPFVITSMNSIFNKAADLMLVTINYEGITL